MLYPFILTKTELPSLTQKAILPFLGQSQRLSIQREAYLQTLMLARKIQPTPFNREERDQTTNSFLKHILTRFTFQSVFNTVTHSELQGEKKQYRGVIQQDL